MEPTRIKPRVVAFTCNHGAPTVLLADGTIWELSYYSAEVDKRWRELKGKNERPFMAENESPPVDDDLPY